MKNTKRNLFHYGNKTEQGYEILVNRKVVLVPTIPEEPKTVAECIVRILHGSEGRKIPMMRVKGYFCDNHKKKHRYSFHNMITMCPGLEKFYGVDTLKELIKLAKTFAI